MSARPVAPHMSFSVHAGTPRSRLIRLDDVDFLGRVRSKLGLADATAALADEHISGA